MGVSGGTPAVATCWQVPPSAPKGLEPSSWLTAAAAGLFVTPASQRISQSNRFVSTSSVQIERHDSKCAM